MGRTSPPHTCLQALLLYSRESRWLSREGLSPRCPPCSHPDSLTLPDGSPGVPLPRRTGSTPQVPAICSASFLGKRPSYKRDLRRHLGRNHHRTGKGKGNIPETGAGRKKGSRLRQKVKGKEQTLLALRISRNHSSPLGSFTISKVLPQSLTTLYFEPQQQPLKGPLSPRLPLLS